MERKEEGKRENQEEGEGEDQEEEEGEEMERGEREKGRGGSGREREMRNRIFFSVNSNEKKKTGTRNCALITKT